MQANTDIACLLSGGIDSSLLLTYAKSINDEILAITADFGINDDAKLRSQSLINTLNHKKHFIKEISDEEVQNSLKNTSQICDCPFDDTSIIPSNIVYSTAKQLNYPVTITGDGADEIFGGYESFYKLKKLNPFLNKKFDPIRINTKKLLANFFKKVGSNNFERIFMSKNDLLCDLSCNGFKVREWYNIIDTDYDPLHHVKKILKDLNGISALDKFRILNLTFKLPNQMLLKVDRTSMYNSIEARPIFLNNDIVDAALSIPSSILLGSGRKGILKKIYQSKIPNNGWKLPKTGFGWKTDSYENLFTENDNEYLKSKVGINGLSLLKNRMSHHKRGYYGLYSLTSWINNTL